MALADTAVLTKRGLIHTIRIPELLVFSTIQPVLFVLLFRYVFGGAIPVRGTSYVNFLMAGIFVQTIAFGGMTTGVGIADDLQKGLVDRFRSLPMARSALLVARTLSDLVRNALVVFLMLGVGLAVGFRPNATALEWVAVFAILLLVSFTFSWIGAAIGLLVRNVEAVQSAGFIWLFPLTFASSAFVPTSTMPAWLRAFADNQPITQAVNAVRGLALHQPAGAAVWHTLVWSAGILLVFIPLSVSTYRRATAE
jgi:ABC-2 type transport system permease protein/oleandomycin transport system permease protein